MQQLRGWRGEGDVVLLLNKIPYGKGISDEWIADCYLWDDHREKSTLRCIGITNLVE